MFNNYIFLCFGRWHGMGMQIFFIYRGQAPTKCFVAHTTPFLATALQLQLKVASVFVNSLCECKTLVKSKTGSFRNVLLVLIKNLFPQMLQVSFSCNISIYISTAFVGLSVKSSSFKDHIATKDLLCIILQMIDI